MPVRLSNDLTTVYIVLMKRNHNFSLSFIIIYYNYLNVRRFAGLSVAECAQTALKSRRLFFFCCFFYMNINANALWWSCSSELCRLSGVTIGCQHGILEELLEFSANVFIIQTFFIFFLLRSVASCACEIIPICHVRELPSQKESFQRRVVCKRSSSRWIDTIIQVKTSVFLCVTKWCGGYGWF